MTSVINPQLTTALRRAAVRATRAPSVHNTQPWRFLVDGESLQIHVDPSRQLRVLDPHGVRALLSCGSALFNSRVALAASGHRVRVDRFPDPDVPGLVARVVIDETAGPGEAALSRLDPMIDVRRTNRRQFSDDAVPADLVDALVDAANIEGGDVIRIERPVDRIATARLSRLADRIETSDPAFRAELLAWTGRDIGRWDVVSSPQATSHAVGYGEGDLPAYDTDPRRAGRLPSLPRSDGDHCLLLLGTLDDNPLAWLRAGEALERMLLEITRKGYAATPLTAVTEVSTTNDLLRSELRLAMHPHVLLRVGRAPASPSTRRRRLVDVLSETG